MDLVNMKDEYKKKANEELDKLTKNIKQLQEENKKSETKKHDYRAVDAEIYAIEHGFVGDALFYAVEHGLVYEEITVYCNNMNAKDWEKYKRKQGYYKRHPENREHSKAFSKAYAEMLEKKNGK